MNRLACLENRPIRDGLGVCHLDAIARAGDTPLEPTRRPSTAEVASAPDVRMHLRDGGFGDLFDRLTRRFSCSLAILLTEQPELPANLPAVN